MSQGSKAGHLPQLPKIRLLLPYLTLNKPGFSEYSKAEEGEGGGQIPPSCVTSYFKARDHDQELIKHLMS